MSTSLQDAENQNAHSEIHLPLGLIGMRDLQRFAIIADPECRPFVILRSIDAPPIEFVAIEPQGIIPDYPLELTDEDAETLEVDPQGNVPFILNIATVKSLQPQKVTANLVAPIVINRRNGKGKQVVLANYQRYSTTYPLIDEGT